MAKIQRGGRTNESKPRSPVVSTNQTVNASKDYDAFGNQTSSSGTWSGPFHYGGPYGYQTDADTNLKLLGHRYYDPTIGRFLTRDIAKDGHNWYSYCANSPLRNADPTGLDPKVRGIISKYFGRERSIEYGNDKELSEEIHRSNKLTQSTCYGVW